MKNIHSNSLIHESVSHVFYVSSHGSADDHWFNWFAKALNSHPDIMIYFGESVRQKYLNERSRKERPDLIQFTRFLADLGRAYLAIGNCYCYRAYQLEQLWDVFQQDVCFVNLVRHPYCWLHFYVTWRCGNMGMPLGNSAPLDHEWSVVNHEVLSALNLKPYTREDVDIWSSYQGMLILNRMVSDLRSDVRNYCLEDIVKSPDLFNKIVSYLTHGRVQFDSVLMELVYSWVYTPFRGGLPKRILPREEYALWPDWKKYAFKKIVNEEAMQMFEGYGYIL
ncbi:hypothetical protein [Methylomonas fluvii]|uniref:Sulfotransferase family protein n=1 Tax=Methylomonas fluvii TaxID=1854564 RepID=A0ABR9DGQ7_9GAMM|nr:hypothetical protein [Methylomonas fluvii]MBD9362046.1 hypothetical protein [Methylomonas fluvii]